MGYRNVYFQMLGLVLGALKADGYSEDQVVEFIRQAWARLPLDAVALLDELRRQAGR
jgi:hypothetical protein